MKTRLSLKTFCGCVLLLAVLSTGGAAQTAAVPQAAPATQNPQRTGICGGQPLCYETTDFAAYVTDYRVSEQNGIKVMDATVRFQNKTNQPLILGYTQGSGLAIDDQGNRYGLNPWGGANSVRGIGQVAGNQIDPKFVVQAGGVGDALFEWAGRPGAVAGVTYEHDVTIREITALEGHQFALAGEFPIQFKGLANGVTSGAAASQAASGQGLMPGAGSAGVAAAQPVCPPGASVLGNTASSVSNTANSVAGQNVPAGANSTISNTTATVASLKSIFGHKKAAAAAAPSAAAGAATPCVSAAPSTPSTASTASAVTAAVPPPAAANAAVVSGPTTSASGIASPAPAMAKKAAVATTTTTKTTTQTTKVVTKKPPATPPPAPPQQ
ncbi:MAG TPA: hypothetical protein VI455_14125 [Terriglobia bacterium]